jgi:hypothetical protein
LPALLTTGERDTQFDPKTIGFEESFAVLSVEPTEAVLTRISHGRNSSAMALLGFMSTAERLRAHHALRC